VGGEDGGVDVGSRGSDGSEDAGFVIGLEEVCKGLK